MPDAFELQCVNALFICIGTQGGAYQCLRFTAGENGWSVNPGEVTHFDADGAHFIKVSPVNALLFFQNHFAYDIFFCVMKQIVESSFQGFIAFRVNLVIHISFDLTHGIRSFMFACYLHCFIKFWANETIDPVCKSAVNFLLRHRSFFFADLFFELNLQINQLFDPLVSKLQCAHHFIFTDFFGARFDHDDTICGSGHEKLDVAFFTLFVVGIENEAAVNPADSCSRYWVVKRYIGNHQCSRGTGHGNDIRRVGLIVGNNEADELSFVSKTVWKQRAERPVDQPTGKGLKIARSSFPFKKSTRNFSSGVSFFPVIHSEWEKVNSLSWLWRHSGRNQHHGFTLWHNHRSTGLSSQITCF